MTQNAPLIQDPSQPRTSPELGSEDCRPLTARPKGANGMIEGPLLKVLDRSPRRL